MLKVPGVTAPGSRCVRTVNLIDLYPTITELAGILHNPENEGHSLVPLLKNVEKKWDYPSLTTMGEGRHAVRSERYRYIRYQDGAEELYDSKVDPLEWVNLANKSKYNRIKKRLGAFVPENSPPEIEKRK